MTTLAKIAEAVRQRAADEPDLGLAPHEACRYYDPETEQPVCIVGRALYDIDIAPDILVRLDHSVSGEPLTKSSCTIDSIEALTALGVEPPERGSEEWWTLSWLAKAQSEQDGGVSWSEAVEVADDLIENRKARAEEDDSLDYVVDVVRLRYEAQRDEEERRHAAGV